MDDCQGDLLRIRLPDGREGLAPRQRLEDDRVRILIAPRASVPDRPERSSADLSQKLATLREACASLAIPWSRGHVDVKCRRSDVAETALSIASSRPARDFRKTWRFELTGERGMDAGGVARECWAHVAEAWFRCGTSTRANPMIVAPPARRVAWISRHRRSRSARPAEA